MTHNEYAQLLWFLILLTGVIRSDIAIANASSRSGSLWYMITGFVGFLYFGFIPGA